MEEEEEDASIDLTDIDAENSLELIIEIDKRLRPSIAQVTGQADVEIVYAYHAAMKREVAPVV
jgi:hypothetical protein